MITVLTATPDELVDSLKSYFLIEDHFVILTIPDEIDEYVDTWCELYEGRTNSHRLITFTLPFLAIVETEDMLNVITTTFNTKIFHEIDDIEEAGITFIESGFLPLNCDIITYYVTNKLTNTPQQPIDLILRTFEALGYITSTNEPTDKLLNTLYSNEDTVKYAQSLLLLMSNGSGFSTTPQYISAMVEILKLIDVNVHAAALSLTHVEQ